MDLIIEKITDNFGVQINGFDCSKPLQAKDLLIFKKAMQDSHFICFKNQN